MAEGTALRTDPRPARLRQHLATARRPGVDFDAAWAGGRLLVLTALARSQRAEWQSALHATRETWRRAYEGRASDRVDWGGGRAGGLRHRRRAGPPAPGGVGPAHAACSRLTRALAIMGMSSREARPQLVDVRHGPLAPQRKRSRGLVRLIAQADSSTVRHITTHSDSAPEGRW